MSAFKVQQSAVAKTAAGSYGSIAPVRALEQSFGRPLRSSGGKPRRTTAPKISSPRLDVGRCQLSRYSGRPSRKPPLAPMGRNRRFAGSHSSHSFYIWSAIVQRPTAKARRALHTGRSGRKCRAVATFGNRLGSVSAATGSNHGIGNAGAVVYIDSIVLPRVAKTLSDDVRSSGLSGCNGYKRSLVQAKRVFNSQAGWISLFCPCFIWAMSTALWSISF